MSKQHKSSQVETSTNSVRIVVVGAAVALVAVAIAIFLIIGNESDSSNENDTVTVLNSENTVEDTSTEAGDPVAGDDNGESVAHSEVTEPIDALIVPAEYQNDFVSTSQAHVLLDVREDWEFAEGHIEGASNISVEEIDQRLDELPRDVPIVLYCRSGNRSATAADILVNNGFTMVYDLGGVIQWEQAGFDLIR